MRIVAGKYKGRRLAGPEGTAARPTSDKVREALFSILAGVEGARVLDLFAGTGALALEALSRGADSAVLVERDRKMGGVARRNLEEVLGDERGAARLIGGDAIKYLGGAQSESFDLVFLDPPYAQATALGVKLEVLLPAVLAPGARVVVESDRRTPLDLPASGLTQRSQHRYGDTLITIFDAP